MEDQSRYNGVMDGNKEYKNLLVLLDADKETEHLEFKTAEKSLNFDSGKRSVCGYVVALANEGGGKLILGVTDKKPRTIRGTSAFKNVSKLEKDLYRKIRRRITVTELDIEGKCLQSMFHQGQ